MIFKKIRQLKERKKELKKNVEKLSKMNLSLDKNGYFVKKEKSKQQNTKVYKLDDLNDQELITLINHLDVIYPLSEDDNKNNIVNQAEEIKKILIKRVTNTIKEALEVKNNQLSYDEILFIKTRLQYYLTNLIYNEKILNLINKLEQILKEKKEEKKYEKTCLSI